MIASRGWSGPEHGRTGHRTVAARPARLRRGCRRQLRRDRGREPDREREPELEREPERERERDADERARLLERDRAPAVERTPPRLEVRRRDGFRWSLGTSVRTTARVSCGISPAR